MAGNTLVRVKGPTILWRVWMLSLWMMTAFAETPIQITVTDPHVTEVILVCKDRTVTSKVYDGVARFSEHLNNCSIEFRSTVGTLRSPGVYTCSMASGCKENGVVHKPVSDAEGRVNIILMDGSATRFELKCGNAYRERAPVDRNTAIFNAVPNGGCILHYKGDAPAKVDNIEPGTYECSAIGGIGKCRRR